ncbi:class II fructose-bisphosphate aldolase [Vagococcus carniphilus]|uniref:class II fructose-bisphosphate aldolase n=1 Tax=Vagococcus carniphilus TaxID=218144 RepID=UPI00288E09A5|nr:class II fructose-bisphosphate aldolase [Vagococcus carniphilus]MDT2813963.1 class II fructose-bisphosphate aldolase [Vagococcus carniphilus]MDT2864010.1 class II fructose-bisphosphate aldolase [Vagococcus carniphilus]
MLVSSKELYKIAEENSFAIPATNFIDLDSARTYVETAEKLKKPLILAFAESHMELISLEEAALIGKYLAEKSKMPVVLHLDHGETEEVIKKAIELGFSSVMIDASRDSIEENIRKTKSIVEYAHSKNVVVEAEIGHVGSGVNYETPEETDSIYTEVEDAIRFVEETNVDSLAVSIGTAHGFYKGTPKINFERLAEIHEAVSVPLVLHGGSSSGDENLEKCATSGISKINIFTDFLTAAIQKINAEKPEDYIQLKGMANTGMEETLTHYFNVFHTEEVNN